VGRGRTPHFVNPGSAPECSSRRRSNQTCPLSTKWIQGLRKPRRAENDPSSLTKGCDQYNSISDTLRKVVGGQAERLNGTTVSPSGDWKWLVSDTDRWRHLAYNIAAILLALQPVSYWRHNTRPRTIGWKTVEICCLPGRTLMRIYIYFSLHLRAIADHVSWP